MLNPQRVLCDTTVLIDLLTRRPKAIARLRALAEQRAQAAISIVSVAEIYGGLVSGEEERTARLLELFDMIPLSQDLARRTGELVAARRRVGRSYTIDDMMIAATAIEFNYLLYTTNKKDFEVPRLAFYTPVR